MADAASELEALAYRLRLAGDELARELTQAMRRGVDPAREEIRAALPHLLPKRYAAVIEEDVRLGINVRTSQSDPGVSLTAATTSGRARKLRYLDEGRLTHPLFGDREHWYTQDGPAEGVLPGWFTGPAEASGDRVRRELGRALEDIAARAAGGTG
jgi:hypothetical protein